MGGAPHLIGGGLIRSTGGWAALKELRAAKQFQKSDERILGNGDFVESVLASHTEAMKRRYDLQSKKIDLDEVYHQVAKMMMMESGGLGSRETRANGACP